MITELINYKRDETVGFPPSFFCVGDGLGNIILLTPLKFPVKKKEDRGRFIEEMLSKVTAFAQKNINSKRALYCAVVTRDDCEDYIAVLASEFEIKKCGLKSWPICEKEAKKSVSSE